MGILNLTSDGLPSVGIAVTRYLARFGPASRSDIIRDVAPAGLSDTAADRIPQVLNRWTQIGVLSETDGACSVADEEVCGEIRDSKNPLHPTLRAYVLSKVMEFASGPDVGEEDNPVYDFLVAARWLLASNPFTHPVQSRQEAEARRLPLVNYTRWSGLVEWMTFLGLAETFGEKGWLLPNPAEAIGWHLGELTKSEPDVPWRTFIDWLDRIIPVTPTEQAAGGLPVVTSLALQSLSDEGRIVLRLDADASTVALTHPSGTRHRDFSHVTIAS